MAIQTKSLTVSYNGITNVLKNETLISRITTKNTPIQKKLLFAKKFMAIWDTGATNSVISKNVVKKCNLKPTGVVEVHTVAGKTMSETYLVDIFLLSKVILPNVKVTIGEIGGDADILLGMDVIAKGDFVITNKDGKTVFSFRIPSVECIDFVKQKPAKAINQPPNIASTSKSSKKVGRNEPCWCGSGKKYKYCHGKT